jgi:hypothetical protein
MPQDFSKMSDAELESYIASASPKNSSPSKDMSKVSDADLEAIIKSYGPEKSSNRGAAAVEGFGQGLTLGYTPQINALAEKPATGLLNAIASSKLGAKMLDVPQNPNVQADDYITARDYYSKRSSDLARENPKEFLAGQIGGGLTSGYFLPGMGAGKNLGTMGKIAVGAGTGGLLSYIQNPGETTGKIDPLQTAARIDNAKTGAMIGGVIPLVSKGLQSAAESNLGQKTLKNISDTTAIKQAGAMLKDFRNMFDKGKLAEIADTLKSEHVNVPVGEGKFRTEKILSAGDTFDDVAHKAELLKSETGEKIGQVYNSLDEQLTNPNLKLTPEQAAKLNSVQRFNPATDVDQIQKMIVDKYGKKIGGKGVLAKIQSVLDDMKSRSETMTDSLALKGEIDEMISYSRKTQDLPEFQKALKDIRNFIRDKTNAYAENAGKILNIEGASELQKLNKTYGNASTIYDMAADRVQRESANRMFGLTDTIAGIGVGGAAAAAKGDISAESLAYGVGGALLNKAGRKYGPGLLSGLTGTMSSAMKPIAGPVSNYILAPAASALSSPTTAGAIANQDVLRRRLKQLKGE